jgi:hypothetical protein
MELEYLLDVCRATHGAHTEQLKVVKETTAVFI